MRCGRCWRPDARSTVKHQPADVVPQPLVVKDEFANRPRELVTLPLALESRCDLALAFRRGGTCGLDRIGGRTELVRGDVCDGAGLASSVRGMPCCPTQVSGRAHCMAPRRASLGHLDLATHPGAGLLDRLTRTWILRLSRLEEVKDVLGARCRPKSEKMMIRISEGPTATRHHLLALWAASCAEHVLGLFESAQPDDRRPRVAIEQTRAWVRGGVKMMQARRAAGQAQAAARNLRGAPRHAAYAAGQAAVVPHVAAHELGAAAYAIKAVRAAAPEDEAERAGRIECRWQREQLPEEIRELVLDDQRLRNDICWLVFDC